MSNTEWTFNDLVEELKKLNIGGSVYTDRFIDIDYYFSTGAQAKLFAFYAVDVDRPLYSGCKIKYWDETEPGLAWNLGYASLDKFLDYSSAEVTAQNIKNYCDHMVSVFEHISEEVDELPDKLKTLGFTEDSESYSSYMDAYTIYKLNLDNNVISIRIPYVFTNTGGKGALNLTYEVYCRDSEGTAKIHKEFNTYKHLVQFLIGA